MKSEVLFILGGFFLLLFSSAVNTAIPTIGEICIEGENFPLYASSRFTPRQLEELHLLRDTEMRRHAYITRFHQTALQEETKFGIPFEITLAQGIIESNAGLSSLTVKHQNHFGIKSSSGVSKITHEYEDGKRIEKVSAKFRTFSTDWECFRYRSKMLTSGRYILLKKYWRWEDWAILLGPKTKDGYQLDIERYLEEGGGKLGDRKWERLQKYMERAPKKVKYPDGTWGKNPYGLGYATSVTYPFTLAVYVNRYELTKLKKGFHL